MKKENSLLMAGKKISIFGDSAATVNLENPAEKNQFFAELSGPLHISWEVTRKCVLKCRHCLNNCGMSEKEELSREEALRLTGQIIEVNPFNLCFCGGEPLLREDILEIASLIGRHRINMSIVTSGVIHISLEKAKQIIQAGIKNLQVSIDGATAETHEYMRGVPGCFEKTIASAKNVIKSGLSLAIAYTPTKFNIDEFPQFVKLAVDLGCKNIRIMPIMPMGRALANKDVLFPSAQDYLRLVWMIKQKQIECAEKEILIEWGDPLEHIYSYAFMNQVPFSFDINKDGFVILSPYLPISFGNIKKHSIKEYWEAGIRKMWIHPKVLELARNTITMDRLFHLFPRPYLDPHLELDLFKELN